MDIIGNMNPVLDNALRSCLIDDCTIYGYISPNSCIVIGPIGVVILKLVEGNVSYKEGYWRLQTKGFMGFWERTVDIKNPSEELSESYHQLKNFLVRHGLHTKVNTLLVFNGSDLNNLDPIPHNRSLKISSLSSYFSKLILKNHLLRPNFVNKVNAVMYDFVKPAV